jgi:beta-lactamase regulating signal transducer with metallopeptidase domain
MNFLYEFIPKQLLDAIGWTIFHSMWQAIIAAILVGSILITCNRKSARLRYNLTLTVMFILFAASVITFYKVYNSIEPETKYLTTDSTLLNSDAITSLPATSPKSEIEILNNIQSLFNSNISFIVSIWFIGIIIFSFRIIGGLVYVQRLRKFGIKTPDEQWSVILKNISRKIDLKRVVNIFESSLVKIPVAIGYFKPVILFPLGILSGLPQNQIEAIIAHELAHIKRNDFIINLIQTFIETLFFYHPAIWWISSVINGERENCCDDIAIDYCLDSIVYSNALFNIQETCTRERNVVLAALGQRNNLYRRIIRMNSTNSSVSYGIKFAAFAILFLISTTLSVFSVSSAKDKPKDIIEASFINPFTFENEKTSFVSSVNLISNTADTNSIKKGSKTLKFYGDDKSKDTKYKAKLEDGKLVELHINGEKTPDNELHKYDALVAENAKEYDELMAEYHDKAKKYREEMKELHKKIDKFGNNDRNNFNYNFPDKHSLAYPNFPFDSTNWEEMAENLQKGIQEGFLKHPIVIPPIHIPQINIPPINIPEMNFNWDCDSTFNNEAFKEGMKKWKHNFKINMKNFNLNMDDFKVDMIKMKADLMQSGLNNETFKHGMTLLGKNMGKLKNHLRELKSFNIELRDELENDNLLKDDDSIDNLTISKDEMIVDGKKVSPELHEKYLTLYKKHFGKELKGDEAFRIEN